MNGSTGNGVTQNLPLQSRSVQRLPKVFNAKVECLWSYNLAFGISFYDSYSMFEILELKPVVEEVGYSDI